MASIEDMQTTSKEEDLEIDERDFNLKFWFADDGRINLNVSQRAAWIPDDMYSESTLHMPTPEESEIASAFDDADPSPPPPYSEQSAKLNTADLIPRMNILMLAIGSLEEISPFITFARFLSTLYGHRVRLASHTEYKAAIEVHGIEFFLIGSTSVNMIWSSGPRQNRSAINKARISEWRKGMDEVFRQSWKACVDSPESESPFVADVIIASTLCLSHMHCAERLGVPLHLISSIPWTPTGDFPHPLANIQQTNSTYRITSILSYAAIETLLWREIGDDVNRFRKDTLGLEPMDLMFAPGLLNRMKVPIMYSSNFLIGKRPGGWGRHVHVCDPETEVDSMGHFFHHHLALSKRMCPVTANRIAYLVVEGYEIPLSSMAAITLMNEGVIDARKLRACSLFEWDLAHRPWDPLTGLTAATSDALTSILLGAAAGPLEAYRQMKSSGEKATSNKQGVRGSIELDSYSSVAVSTGKGIESIMTAGLKTPVTFTYGLAKGFQNVPRLYGDTTVRESDKITGWKSGLVASGKGFGYGLYDGLSGFFTQPVQGAQKEGAAGFLKGFGKGVGGLVFKPAARACGVPGYAFKGVYEELRKLGRDDPARVITAAQLAGGQLESDHLTGDEKAAIIILWKQKISVHN